jgi:hypothetical protein
MLYPVSRNKGVKSTKTKPIVCIFATIGIINFLLLFSFFHWFISSPSQTTLIAKLQSRIQELEEQEHGGTELHDIPCHNCDKKLSNELNRRFNFFVLNLDRRADKMRCVRDQFANFGIHVRRMHGIDSLRMDVPNLALLPDSVKRFLASNPGQKGHVGCLYGHIRFMMGAAAGHDGCGAVDTTLRSDESGLLKKKWVGLLFRNKWPTTVNVYWIAANGKEILKGSIASGKELHIDTTLMQAWRVREQVGGGGGSGGGGGGDGGGNGGGNGFEAVGDEGGGEGGGGPMSSFSFRLSCNS